MNSSDIPDRFPIPWANGATTGYIRSIPTPSQTPTATDAPASLTDGFPPETFAAAGAIPPNGMDFNGILNWITECIRWGQAGGPAVYNSTFATAIGGYPIGARLNSSTLTGVVWLNTVDGNTTDPDGGSAAGWTKAFDRGTTSGINWRTWPAGNGKSMIRMVGQLSFSSESYQSVTLPFTLGSVTDYGVSTIILSPSIYNDQMAQVGVVSTTSISIYMNEFTSGTHNWPIGARWWVEGILP